jgi:hypothetical protein
MAGQARDLQMTAGCESSAIITARACPAPPRLLAQALSHPAPGGPTEPALVDGWRCPLVCRLVPPEVLDGGLSGWTDALASGRLWPGRPHRPSRSPSFPPSTGQRRRLTRLPHPGLFPLPAASRPICGPAESSACWNSPGRPSRTPRSVCQGRIVGVEAAAPTEVGQGRPTTTDPAARRLRMRFSGHGPMPAQDQHIRPSSPPDRRPAASRSPAPWVRRPLDWAAAGGER